MSTIDLNDLAGVGAIRDVPSYMLPPEVWGLAINMRPVDLGMEQIEGWARVFGGSSVPPGGPIVPPEFAMALSTLSEQFWLYSGVVGGVTKIGVYNGAVHADISRTVGGAYGVAETRAWNGTILGGIPVFNNGLDVPQVWLDPQLTSTPMVDLPFWPATAGSDNTPPSGNKLLRAKVVRAVGPYLVAVNLTEDGKPLPHTIQWSHPAEPGAVPTSWNFHNTAVDAGRKDFPDVNSGVLADALALQGNLYLYKESSVWRMRQIGGRFIFGFDTFLETSGLLAPRCVTGTGDGLKHVLATQDDVVWHNGNTVRSVLDKRQRKRVFGEIDVVNFINSFMFCNPGKKEVWFCYPTKGHIQPNVAIVMNYGLGDDFVVTEVDGINFRNAAVGNIKDGIVTPWDGAAFGWDSVARPWDEIARRRTILCGTDAGSFYNLDSGGTKDGALVVGVLQRLGLSLVGRKRSGEWIVDHEVYKLVERVWPKVRGGPIKIRVAKQETVDGPVTWSAYSTFNPATGVVADVGPVSGRAVGIEFATVDNSWRIDGYKYDVTTLGNF